MTVNIVYIPRNTAEKRKIREIQYPLLDQFYDFEETKPKDIIKIIELEERYKNSSRLA